MSIIIYPVFNRTGKLNKSGVYKVNICVMIDRKQHYLSIKHFPKLKKDDWDPKNNRIKSSHQLHSELNRMLYGAINDLDKYVFGKIATKQSVSIQLIRSHFYNQGYDESFNLYAHKFRDTNSPSLATYKKYRTLANHMDQFNKDLKFGDIVPSLLDEFNRYLIKAGLGDGTRLRMFNDLRRITTSAAKEKLMPFDQFLFDDLKFKPKKPKRTSLNLTEIKAILDINIIDEDLARYRDQFLFMCLSGLYYSQFKLLTHSDLVATKKGYVLTNRRNKTDVTFIIPLWLFPEQMELLSRLTSIVAMDDDLPEAIAENNDRILNSQKLFPGTLSDQKYNAKLKIIAEISGINKNLTIKVARHSFTDLCISKGIARQFVSKMLGHSQESTTQIYYNMNVEHVMGAIDQLEL